MREYSPGGSINDDYAYGCDNCEMIDGRPVLIWREDQLPGEHRDHFSLCFECLSKLYFQYAADQDKIGESVIIKRAVIPESLRNEIFKRDGFKCVACGATQDLAVDHVIPFSKGGTSTKDNLRTLCKSCNSKKGNAF